MTSVSGNSEIARRYATALFALAKEQNAIDAVAADLRAMGVMLAESKDLADVATNATLRRADQESALMAIGAAAKFSPLTTNFLGLLAQNRRLGDLADMIAAVQAEVDRHNGETTAEVVTARPLEKAQQDAIAAALTKAMGLTVRLNVVEDPSIIGGLVIRAGSLLVDSSLRTKLSRITRALKSQDQSKDLKKMKEVA